MTVPYDIALKQAAELLKYRTVEVGLMSALRHLTSDDTTLSIMEYLGDGEPHDYPTIMNVATGSQDYLERLDKAHSILNDLVSCGVIDKHHDKAPARYVLNRVGMEALQFYYMLVREAEASGVDKEEIRKILHETVQELPVPSA